MSTAQADVLGGHRDTGKLPVQSVRGAVLSRGAVGDAPYVKMWFWDATKPLVG